MVKAADARGDTAGSVWCGEGPRDPFPGALDAEAGGDSVPGIALGVPRGGVICRVLGGVAPAASGPLALLILFAGRKTLHRML